MEWQAGYVCGALLMSLSHLRQVVGAYQQKQGLFGPAAIGTPHADGLIKLMQTTSRVSADAARVRLKSSTSSGTAVAVPRCSAKDPTSRVIGLLNTRRDSARACYQQARQAFEASFYEKLRRRRHNRRP